MGCVVGEPLKVGNRDGLLNTKHQTSSFTRTFLFLPLLPAISRPLTALSISIFLLEKTGVNKKCCRKERKAPEGIDPFWGFMIYAFAAAVANILLVDPMPNMSLVATGRAVLSKTP